MGQRNYSILVHVLFTVLAQIIQYTDVSAIALESLCRNPKALSLSLSLINILAPYSVPDRVT